MKHGKYDKNSTNLSQFHSITSVTGFANKVTSRN